MAIPDARGAAPHAAEPPPGTLRPAELALILAFWVVLGAVLAAGRLVDPRGPGPDAPVTRAFAAAALAQALIWAALTPVVFVAVARFSPERTGHRLAAAVLVLAVVVMVTVVAHLAGNGVRQWLVAELGIGGGGRGGGLRDRLRDGLRDGVRDAPSWREGWGGGPRGGRGRGPWRIDRFGVINDVIIAGGVLAAGVARDVSLRYRARKEQATRLQAQLAVARLDALRRQLDPHFLFNTLNAVSALVERDPRGVRRMIARLGELLRHSMEGGDEQEVPLERELAMLQRYVDIMLVRFQGRLEVTLDVDDAARAALVPGLVLQPLVENAIRHGVGRLEGTGHIVVEARRAGDHLLLRVRDDGAGMDAAAVDAALAGEGGVGLRNTRERLAQLHGDAARLVLGPGEGGGTVAEVELPFRPAPASAPPTTTTAAGDQP